MSVTGFERAADAREDVASGQFNIAEHTITSAMTLSATTVLVAPVRHHGRLS